VYQHAWATCVEVVGFITENQPKFEQGDQRYQYIFRLASEVVSRAHERKRSSLLEMEDADVVSEFSKLDRQLNFMNMLKSLNAADRAIADRRNIILIFSEEDDLEIQSYDNATEALRSLFELEKTMPKKDIVLVRAASNEDVRVAFRNYFSDAREFISLVEEGCKRLS
jgi:hypothetical protein